MSYVPDPDMLARSRAIVAGERPPRRRPLRPPSATELTRRAAKARLLRALADLASDLGWDEAESLGVTEETLAQIQLELRDELTRRAQRLEA